MLSSFSHPNLKIRLVKATSAFGLGVDILDISRVIPWELPSNVEEYVQEAERAVCDGKSAHAILYFV